MAVKRAIKQQTTKGTCGCRASIKKGRKTEEKMKNNRPSPNRPAPTNRGTADRTENTGRRAARGAISSGRAEFPTNIEKQK